jgi:hypothetical protein
VILIIDVPNNDFVESMLLSTEYTPFFDNNIDASKNKVEIVIHLSSLEVLLNEKYKNYFEKHF